MVQHGQRLDAIGEVDEIESSFRRRREGRYARGEQCGGDDASAAHGCQQLSAVCAVLTVREVVRAAQRDSAHRENVREATKASQRRLFEHRALTPGLA